MQKELHFIDEEKINEILPITKLNKTRLNNLVKELEESLNNFQLPENHSLFHNYSDAHIEMCKEKVKNEIKELKQNIDIINESENWKNTLSMYLFDFKINVLFKELWFLRGKSILLDNHILVELSKVFNGLYDDINNYDVLKYYEFLSDGNINYFVLDCQKYTLKQHIDNNTLSQPVSYILNFIEEAKKDLNLKLLIAIYY